MSTKILCLAHQGLTGLVSKILAAAKACGFSAGLVTGQTLGAHNSLHSGFKLSKFGLSKEVKTVQRGYKMGVFDTRKAYFSFSYLKTDFFNLNFKFSKNINILKYM